MKKEDYLEDFVREVIKEHLFEHGFPYPRIPALRVYGTEVTQSIQYYRAKEHLTDPADRGPDNSLRLVAYKAAWVRVYVRGYPDPLTGVSGTITLDRQIYWGMWDQVAVYTPEPPGSITAEVDPIYASERDDIDSTLNFIIPANEMWGNLRLHIEVNNGSNSASADLEIDATLKQTIRFAGIMVGYNGSNAAGTSTINIAAPVQADLQNTSAWTLTTYPVSEAEYRVVSTITQNTPLTDAASCNGCCTPNWNTLIADLAAEKLADGEQPGDLYFGLLANGIPMGSIVGCASSYVGSGGDGEEITMAHELGHQLGFGHSPCGGVGSTADAAYPAYEPYDPAGNPTASIGEYGLDINNGDVKSPANHKCYMSYCRPRWMSIFRYGSLVNHVDLHPEYVGVWRFWLREWLLHEKLLYSKEPGPPPPPFDEKIVMLDVISIIGIVSMRSLNIKTVVRVPTFVDTSNLKRTKMIAEMLDENGKIISSAAVYKLPQITSTNFDRDEGCNGYDIQEDPDSFVIRSYIPNVGKGVTIRIVDGENNKELWSRKAPENEPKITKFDASVNKEENLDVTCSIQSPTKQHELWVRWSNNDGKSWHPIKTHLTLDKRAKKNQQYQLPLRSVPAGEVLLQLVVNDGFYTTFSESVTINSPKQPYEVSLLHPKNGQLLAARRRMHLWAIVNDNAGNHADNAKCSWLIDGKEVAEGSDAWITTPPTGWHACVLKVNVDDSVYERKVEFETVTLDGKSK